MTGQASGVAAQELLLVRRRMTLGALRHIPMLQVMAGGAIDLGVFAGAVLPGSVDLAVTGTAGGRGGIFSVGDLPWLVHLMTGRAEPHNLSSVVRLRMAGDTVGLIAMNGMASLAGKLRMFAGELDELLLG